MNALIKVLVIMLVLFVSIGLVGALSTNPHGTIIATICLIEAIALTKLIRHLNALEIQ